MVTDHNMLTVWDDNPDRVKRRANLIGKIVWQMVEADAQNTTGRTIQLLAGLRPEHLVGISRLKPKDIGKKIDFRVRRDIDESLCLMLPKSHLTDCPAVHFRNSDLADVILFAVSDEERDTVGASLNPVSRIDRNSIQYRVDFWAIEIARSHGASATSDERFIWIEALLEGLGRSGVTKELDQYADFVLSMRDKVNLPWPQRVNASAPSLHLPTNSFREFLELRVVAPVLVREFRSMFRNAEREVGGFSYLLDKTDNRINIAQLTSRLDADEGSPSSSEDMMARAAIRELIADHKFLRHGTWRKSQEAFVSM